MGKISLVSRLRRLWSAQRGNVFAITAAAVIPLIGIVGGALDMSRIYVSQSRLQQACDAGALAGRKNMSGATFDDASLDAANRAFDTNFVPGKFGTTESRVSYTANASGALTGVATATVPTTLMRVFGIAQKPVAVSCTADLHLPDTDVMFVLDTTGSMADSNPGDSTSRIVAMRAAVSSFYTTLETAKAAGTAVRYGFVPYSETVNVGYLLKRDWMVDRWAYQSRVPDGVDTSTSTSTSTTKTTNSPVVVISGSVNSYQTYLSLEDCQPAANTLTNRTINLSTTTEPYPGGGTKTTVEKQRTRDGSQYSVAIRNGQCVQTETRYDNYVEQWTQTTVPDNSTTTTTTTNYWWRYLPVTYEVWPLKGARADGLMAGGSITALINNQHKPRTVTWQGCIEERDTNRTRTYSPLPLDMDIDAIPDLSRPETQWRPALPQLVYARTSMTSYYVPEKRVTSNYTNVGDYMSGTYAVCPAQARKLAWMNASTLTNYLASLTPAGQTYHDIGMIWGARLLSPTGLFASENSTSTNGGDIARHLIFMTDGDTDTEVNHYDAYGWPALDRRRSDASVTPTKAEQDAIVAERLSRICAAAKGKNITIWVIAFGTSLTSLLNDCASPGKAYQANNTAELNAAFAQIATQISQLRVTS